MVSLPQLKSAVQKIWKFPSKVWLPLGKASSHGLPWNWQDIVGLSKTAVISSLREISCLHTIWAAYKYGNEDTKAVEKFTKDEMRPFKDKWTLQNNAILALKRLLAEGVDIHTACSRLEDVYHWGICGKASCFL